MNSKTNYEEYKQLLTSVLKEQSEELVFRKQLKNNNVYLDAICLKNKSVSPVVYFESYFENFKSCTSIEEIPNQILDVLHSSQTGFIEKETKNLLNYEEINYFINRKCSISYLTLHFKSKQIICPFRYSREFIFWHKIALNVKGIPKTNIFTRATIISEVCTNTKDWFFKTMNPTIVNNTNNNP